jgi:hypothetical protein
VTLVLHNRTSLRLIHSLSQCFRVLVAEDSATTESLEEFGLSVSVVFTHIGYYSDETKIA